MMAWLEANVLNKPGAMHQPQCCFGKPMYLTISSFPNVDKAETVRPPTPWCHGATGWDDFQGEVLAEWTIKMATSRMQKQLNFWSVQHAVTPGYGTGCCVFQVMTCFLP
jgi:hypothetical protein